MTLSMFRVSRIFHSFNMPFIGLAAFFIGLMWPVTDSIAQESVPDSVSNVSAKPVTKQSVGSAGNAETSAFPELIPTESLAARSALRSFRLSPDGSMIAYLQTASKLTQIVVADAETREVVGGIRADKGTLINWIRWAGNDRLLISTAIMGVWQGGASRFTRLTVLFPKTNEVAHLGDKSAVVDGDNVIHIADDGSFALVSAQKTIYDYPIVMRYELEKDGKIEKVQGQKNGVWTWIADDIGVVRMGLAWKGRRLHVWYREDASSKFKRIAKIKEGDDSRYFDVLQIVSGSSEGYVLEEGENGRVGVRKIDYTTRETIETLYENPNWDVEDIWLDDDGKPIAAFYTDDRAQVFWFDEEYKQFYEKLEKALGNKQMWVTSRSDDGRRMLVSVSNEADPGVLYFYDRDTNRLDELTQYRPEIDFRILAQPKAITYKARDGQDIRAFITLPNGREAKNLPLIVLPHGGPFGVRDELRYDDEVQFLANRGYAVIQPNFRGSGGYGDDFYDLGVGEVGRGMQNDLDDAMDWVVKEGIADPSRVCVIGGSYGGYAALWAVLRNPERYRCAASWAGVTDWDKMLKHDRRYMTSKAGKRWTNRIEGDDEEFDLDDVSPYRLAGDLNRPVLLAHGTDDDNVPFKQFELMTKAAKTASVPLTTLVIEGEGHSFYEKESEERWYDALDAFLSKHNPSDMAEQMKGSSKPASSED